MSGLADLLLHSLEVSILQRLCRVWVCTIDDKQQQSGFDLQAQLTHCWSGEIVSHCLSWLTSTPDHTDDGRCLVATAWPACEVSGTWWWWWWCTVLHGGRKQWSFTVPEASQDLYRFRRQRVLCCTWRLLLVLPSLSCPHDQLRSKVQAGRKARTARKGPKPQLLRVRGWC